MNILIYGSGAIGCHIGYCMYVAGHSVHMIARRKHYDQMKKEGMHIKICENEVIQHEERIRENPRFTILDDVGQIQNIEMNCIFITLKLYDYNNNVLRDLYPCMGKSTAVVPPITKLPFWWFFNLSGKTNEKYRDIDFASDESKYFIRENVICMTMWLSAVIESPGHACVRHVQRGYPLKEVYPKMEECAGQLRSAFEISCLSPLIDDVRSEVFIKSLNAFAFNTVAIDREFDNFQLGQDEHSKECIRKIMIEGEQIPNILNIPISQSIEARIDQTLSSTKHTMSMLHDYRLGRPIELSHLWDSFDRVSDILGIDLPYSRRMYQKVMAKF